MSCCGTSLESKTRHRYITQESQREKLLIAAASWRWGRWGSPSELLWAAKKESLRKCSCCVWCKGIVLCVSVSLLSWTRGTGRACKSKFLEAQWESGGTGRKTWVEAAGKCLPWVLAWVEGEKGPPLLLLRRLKTSRTVGFVFFHKNSKSSKSYCLHRKNVIRESEKAHVGLRTSAAQSCLKNNLSSSRAKQKCCTACSRPSWPQREKEPPGKRGAEQVVPGPACSSPALPSGAVGRRTAGSGMGFGNEIQNSIVIIPEWPPWLMDDSHSNGRPGLLLGDSLWFCIGRWSQIHYEEQHCCKKRVLSDWVLCIQLLNFLHTIILLSQTNSSLWKRSVLMEMCFVSRGWGFVAAYLVMKFRIPVMFIFSRGRMLGG